MTQRKIFGYIKSFPHSRPIKKQVSSRHQRTCRNNQTRKKNFVTSSTAAHRMLRKTSKKATEKHSEVAQPTRVCCIRKRVRVKRSRMAAHRLRKPEASLVIPYCNVMPYGRPLDSASPGKPSRTVRERWESFRKIFKKKRSETKLNVLRDIKRTRKLASHCRRI